MTIVFQEPGSKAFCPSTIRSHFQHVFLVVRAQAPCTPHTSYRWAPPPVPPRRPGAFPRP